MSRTCELTGKGVQSGNNVSHANNKTRRKFLPNLCRVTLMSEATGMSYRLRVSAAALRSVETSWWSRRLPAEGWRKRSFSARPPSAQGKSSRRRPNRPLPDQRHLNELGGLAAKR